MGHREWSIDRGNAKLRVIVAGDGPAVVFIHGWALDCDMWLTQVEALSDRFRVLAYDRRGFGASSGTPSLVSDVDDLRALFQRFGIEHASIVGMSQGARVAALFARENADRVDRLVLDGPPALFVEDEGGSTEIPIEHYRALFRSHGIGAVRKAWLEHPLAHLETDDPAAHARLRSMIERYPGHDLLVTHGASPSLQLRSFSMPVLIINGIHDSEARLASGAQLERLLPDSRRVLVPHAGHLPCLDNPAFYNDALRAFLREGHAATRSARTPEPHSQHKENRS